jgi:transposase
MPLPRLKSSRSKKERRPTAVSWVRLLGLEEVGGPWCTGEIINLLGWKTLKYKETDHDIIILAEPTTDFEEVICTCGESAENFKFWGFTDTAYIRDLPIRCKRARIYYRLQRKRCNNPSTHERKTIQQPLINIHERHSLTTRLVDYIQEESFNIFRNFSQIAEETGVNELTIRNIFTARAKQLDKIKLVETPKWLAIDEVYPRNKKEPRCVISIPERHRVLDLLPDNKPPGLVEWLLHLPDRNIVELVTMDMYEPYRFVVGRLLPKAQIVVDRYHVHNLLSVALKQVMEVVRSSMTSSECRKYMRREELLLKNQRRLSKKQKKDKAGNGLPSEHEQVKKWLEDVPDIAVAYWLVSDFSDILQQSDRQKAENLTELWLKRVDEFVEYFRAKYKKNYKEKWEDPFGNVPHTITNWRASILNYIDFKGRFEISPTNGFAEFANKQIKKAFKMGNGYTFQVLRDKVVYGGVHVKRRPSHPLDEKRPRQKRKHKSGDGKELPHEMNPDANVVSLERARRDRYETEDLLSKPQETPGWVERFEPIDRSKLQLDENEQEPEVKIIEQTLTAEEEDQQPDTEGRDTRRRYRYNPNQLKMF